MKLCKSKIFLSLAALLIWSAPTLGRDLEINGLALNLPDKCYANNPIILQFSGAPQLPASSFFRVEMECPTKPGGAKIDALMGYPESRVTFPESGRYQCEAEIGIVTKSSCAGVSYKKLAAYSFELEAGAAQKK